MVKILDARLLGTTITLFLPEQNVLDIRSLKQPLIHGCLSISEGTEDNSVKFVREL